VDEVIAEAEAAGEEVDEAEINERITDFWFLPVHDGIYTNVDIELPDLNSAIRHFMNDKNFMVSKETYFYPEKPPVDRNAQEILEHKRRIAEQEHASRNYKSETMGTKIDENRKDTLIEIKKQCGIDEPEFDFSEEAIAERNRKYFGY